jgi:UDP-glucose 4-epimerase
MRYLLLGGSGILGSGFVEAIGRHPNSSLQRVSPNWDRPEEAAACVAREVEALPALGQPATVIWAAGVGQVSARRDSMEVERRVLDGLCEALSGLPTEQRARTRLVFASSAGALHGGNDGAAAITESTDPCPISDYGHEKQNQERTCASIAGPGELRVLLCRFSNVYGLAAGRLPGKGLIPAAIRAAQLRQAMTIFVSPDTRRDYVTGPDAAAASLVLADDLGPGTTTALVARGGTSTVAEIVHEVGAILGRRVPATFAVRPESALQPRTLRFAPQPDIADVAARTSMAVAIHRMVHAPLAVGDPARSARSVP